MGNTVPRAGIKPTSLVLWDSVLPLHHIGPLLSPPVYAAPCLRGQYKLLHLSSWNCKSFNASKYIHTDNGLTSHIYIYRVCSTTIQHIPCTRSWSLQPVSWVRCKWERLCLEQESNHISGILSQCATITPCRLPNVSALHTPTSLCSSLSHSTVQTTTLP